jgi:protein TonB
MATLQETPQEPLPAPKAPQPEAIHLSGEIEEEGIFASLVSSFRDVFFPAKLPPLVLTSKPIAVVDPMAVKRSPASTALAVVLHAAVILLIVFLIAKKVQFAPPPKTIVTLTDIPVTPPLAKKAADMGGGGGTHDNAPVTQGRLPKLKQEQIVPPKAPPTIPPKLAVDPSVVVQKDLKMADSNLPNFGIPNAPAAGVSSLGTGNGGGIGSGDGRGIGPGSGDNVGGGVYRVGNGVRAPVLTHEEEAEFSEEARKAKFSGNVMVSMVVDENGNPKSVRVIRGVGMGLDEKALEAARLYKFKPALKDGKPVKVLISLEINFQIY